MFFPARLSPRARRKPMPYQNPQALEGISLDDVLGGLVPGESGRTEFAVQGAKERIAVMYGPKYPVAVVYSPTDRDFICFEPMSAVRQTPST